MTWKTTTLAASVVAAARLSLWNTSNLPPKNSESHMELTTLTQQDRQNQEQQAVMQKLQDKKYVPYRNAGSGEARNGGDSRTHQRRGINASCSPCCNSTRVCTDV